MTALWVVYGCWCAVLCGYDMKIRRLPNALTLGGALVFLLVQYLLHGTFGLAAGFASASVAGLFLVVPWLLRAAGGGDVKMMFAAGAAVGWVGLLDLLILTSLAGVVMACGLLAAGVVSAKRLSHWIQVFLNPKYDRKAGALALPSSADERVRMPFSMAIAIGMMVVLWGAVP